MTPIEESDDLHARVRQFIDASAREEPSESFDALALDIARFQAAHVAPVARLGAARGVDLESARSSASIPALPCDVFRLARVAAHAPERDVRVFRTSGTSLGAETRGEHPFRTTATYEHAALTWGERMLWPDGTRLRVLVLAPSPAEQPDSSLGFMLELFATHLLGPASFLIRLGALQLDALEDACAEARDAGEPAIVMGTSFAFVHLLDRPRERSCRLPEGSRVMQTGGFKGKSREVEAGELRRLIAARFDVPETTVVSEYGMTELSSQLYEGTIAGATRHGVYRPPPWVRVTACDPTSLAPVAEGSIGIARIVDLANVDSSVAIQTADQVRVLRGGDVELLGRAPGAPPRGCSLAIDAILGAR